MPSGLTRRCGILVSSFFAGRHWLFLLVGVMWAINGNGAHKSDNGAVVDAILLAEHAAFASCNVDSSSSCCFFSEYLGISRRSPLFGISLGFGLFAAVNMLVTTAMTHHGILHQSTLRHINSEAYLLAIVLWLGYTLAAAPSEKRTCRSGGATERLEFRAGGCPPPTRSRQLARYHGPHGRKIALSPRRIKSQYLNWTQLATKFAISRGPFTSH